MARRQCVHPARHRLNLSELWLYQNERSKTATEHLNVLDTAVAIILHYTGGHNDGSELPPLRMGAGIGRAASAAWANSPTHLRGHFGLEVHCLLKSEIEHMGCRSGAQQRGMTSPGAPGMLSVMVPCLPKWRGATKRAKVS